MFKNLTKKLQSKSLKIREEGRKEQIFFNKTNHKTRDFFITSPFSSSINLKIHRGQFFTTKKRLAKIWDCTERQVKYLLQKWKDQDLIIIKQIKDSKNFDLGLLITYNPLFNHIKNKYNKYNKKIVHREIPPKAEKERKKKILKNTFCPPKERVILKNNIHINDDFSLKIFNKLKGLKINPKIIERIINQNDFETINKYLDLLNLNKNIQNKAGWFVQAINQKYDLSKVKNWRTVKEEESKLILNKIEQKEKERKLEVERLEKLEKERKLKKEKMSLWRKTNNSKVELQVYQQVLNSWKITKSILAKSILKNRKIEALKIEELRQNIFLKTEVENLILNIKNTDQKSDNFYILPKPKILKKLSSKEMIVQLKKEANQNIKKDKQIESMSDILTKFKIKNYA